MSKSVMIIDTPRDCCECPFGTMAFGKSVCLLDEGNGIECPLKPYGDFIPVGWFKKKIGLLSDNGIYGAEVYQWVLNRWYEDKENWEKENDGRNC